MTQTEHLRQLLSELGPALDAEGVSEFDERTWAFVRDDETTVMLELDESGRNLALSSDIGSPAEEKRLEVYELALIANYLATAPAAPRLALAGIGGGLQVSVSIPADHLEFEALKQALTSLHEQVDRWRNRLADDGTSSEDQPVTGEMHSGVRV